ncbi:MAG TPA: MBL fold metallo-hydrolase, partial [Bacteroidales bacterium]|nr:MBL fold metallo-hydrolase [Bacteroidales bacterium]
YVTDASFISESEKVKLENSEVLVVNALRKSKHISHFSLDEALEIIAHVKPTRAYITHLSHFMGLHEAVQAELPDNVFLAYDGLQIMV